MKALIDADFFAYSIGFSMQEKVDGQVVLKKDYRFWKSNLDKKIESILIDLNTLNYCLYLTGGNNFRLRYPTYKAQRTAEKPLLYKEIRGYMLEHHESHLSENWEADDQVIIDYNLEPENSVMCHIDKDLDQACGLHYRWANGKKQGELYGITEKQGLFNLYVQALEGDRVDNIMGVHGIGKKKAEKILAEAETEEEMYDIVLSKYDTEQRLIDNLHQLYLLRNERDSWTHPIKNHFTNTDK